MRPVKIPLVPFSILEAAAWQEIEQYYQQNTKWEENTILAKAKPIFHFDPTLTLECYLLVNHRLNVKSEEELPESLKERKKIDAYQITFGFSDSFNSLSLGIVGIESCLNSHEELNYDWRSLKDNWFNTFRVAKYSTRENWPLQLFYSHYMLALCEIATKENGYSLIADWEELILRLPDEIQTYSKDLTHPKEYDRQKAKEHVTFLQDIGPKLLRSLIQQFQEVNEDYSQFDFLTAEKRFLKEIGFRRNLKS